MANPQTETTRSPQIVKVLNDLIQLDYDAIEAYEAAIKRIDDATAKEKLTGFMNDHVEHTRNLGRHVERHGGTPKTKGDAKKAMTKGKVVMANLAGDDAVLKAMKSNEDETNAEYEKAIETPGLDAATKGTLESNLADERRHREWIVRKIGN